MVIVPLVVHAGLALLRCRVLDLKLDSIVIIILFVEYVVEQVITFVIVAVRIVIFLLLIITFLFHLLHIAATLIFDGRVIVIFRLLLLCQ